MSLTNKTNLILSFIVVLCASAVNAASANVTCDSNFYRIQFNSDSQAQIQGYFEVFKGFRDDPTNATVYAKDKYAAWSYSNVPASCTNQQDGTVAFSISYPWGSHQLYITGTMTRPGEVEVNVSMGSDPWKITDKSIWKAQSK